MTDVRKDPGVGMDCFCVPMIYKKKNKPHLPDGRCVCSHLITSLQSQVALGRVQAVIGKG